MHEADTLPQTGRMRSRHLSIVVHADAASTHRFAADPDHLPAWAAGLATAPVRREGDALLVDAPMGAVRVRFCPANDLGVLDHWVELPDGSTVLNPVRVLPHPEGSEVLFTVRQLGLTDARFDADCAAVEADLARLKGLVEAQFGQERTVPEPDAPPAEATGLELPA